MFLPLFPGLCRLSLKRGHELGVVCLPVTTSHAHVLCIELEVLAVVLFVCEWRQLCADSLRAAWLVLSRSSSRRTVAVDVVKHFNSQNSFASLYRRCVFRVKLQIVWQFYIVHVWQFEIDIAEKIFFVVSSVYLYHKFLAGFYLIHVVCVWLVMCKMPLVSERTIAHYRFVTHD